MTGYGDKTRQRGMVLITGLIFLVVLTLLGVNAMRSASMEEKMASNLRNAQRAGEAAEAAIRYAETWLRAQDPAASAPNCGGPSFGFCRPHGQNTPSATQWDGRSAEYGQDPNGTDASDLAFVSANPTIETEPRYIIEETSDANLECGATLGVFNCADPICGSEYTIRAEGESGGITVQRETRFVRCYANYSGGACGCSSPTARANTRTQWDMLN